MPKTPPRGHDAANRQVNQARRPPGTRLSMEQMLNDMYMRGPTTQDTIMMDAAIGPWSAEQRQNQLPFEREPNQAHVRETVANRMGNQQYRGREWNDPTLQGGYPYAGGRELGAALDAFKARDAARMQQGGQQLLGGAQNAVGQYQQRMNPPDQRSMLMRILFGNGL